MRRPRRARTTETLPREERGVVESRARRRAPSVYIDRSRCRSSSSPGTRAKRAARSRRV
jgi:hypothetical protein